jgi:hypothetical protein
MCNRQRKDDVQVIGLWLPNGLDTGPQAGRRATLSGASMGREIASVVQVFAVFADLITVAGAATPADKAQIYTGLGLRLACQPGEQLVRTEVHVSPA